MVYYSVADRQPPELETVLDALCDDNCRTIIQTLTEPMTVEEITEATDIPQSTAYQKIAKLSEAGLVAEGVEHEWQARTLARLGCDVLQGFLFARPMPADALAAWLRAHGDDAEVDRTGLLPTQPSHG